MTGSKLLLSLGNSALRRSCSSNGGANLTRLAYLSPSSSRGFSHRPSIVGLASNLMRGIERDFDYMRRQMDKYISRTARDVLPLSSLNENYNSQYSDDLVVVDKDGNRKLQIAFDVRDFEPQDIKVKTQGHYLTITARRERKSDSDYYLREFTQTYELPKDLKLEDLKSQWSDEGVLSIEAPLPTQLEASKQQVRVKEIPIEHAKVETDHNNKDKASIETGNSKDTISKKN